MTVWVECPTTVLGAGWTGYIVPLRITSGF